MIKQLAVTIFLVIYLCSSFARKSKFITGYFDNDNLIDSLSYNFVSDSIHGPVYQCKLSRGNGTITIFSIPVAFESMQINTCGKGCIETYQWQTGNRSYEEYNKYLYNGIYNDWILKSTVTIKPTGKRKTLLPKQLIGINGTRYDKKAGKR